MQKEDQNRLDEVIQDLQKARESLVSLYGEETKTSEMEHIDSAISKLRVLKEED